MLGQGVRTTGAWDVLYGQPAKVRVAFMLEGLRAAMEDLRISSPAYAPQHGPTHADICKNQLDFMEFCLRQLATFEEVKL